MRPSNRVLNELINSVYEAAGNATLWEVFLAKLAETFRADASGLVMHNDGQEAHDIATSYRADPEMLRLYREYFGPLDIWTIRGRSKPAGYVCTSEALCTLEELVTTEMYNDLMVRFDIKHGMFGVIQKSASRWASVSLYRGLSAQEFRQSDVECLRLLVPHVQRAFRLHFEFSELRARSEGFESSLNMLGTAVIFLTSGGNVVFMNSRAEELLREGDGLRLVHGKLTAALGAEAQRLEAMTKGAVHNGNRSSLAAGGTILISRNSVRPLSVTVAPLRGFSSGAGQPPTAVLFISDPDRNVELPSDFLQRCYSLTAAEARLTMILLEGHSLREATDLCGITQNTAKTQLKSVFSKTQVKRQSELIRLLLTGASQLCGSKLAVS